ncbi:MAG: biotin--[acetyl-CoA-carboxylase] ligase [Algoriphagus sp.]|uniref:biotin--[acetyl-CoA-carboxylase] ligase n=1 Tax=Algoriphagus sp. TaxID=1872435 RepID=UPI00273118E2|nr:biotin--[acetyl-CoA-carboxylase] ligase [Algoriphagus sp.]MDP2040140.1 biotin--[acetyl-CoA-carboxylase] ligase [Algoriphagus sp.]MDP3474152.1 biotin--[acetyl-CoA-carboxylase] ligase [Algoriphagus sp.]
MYKILANTIFLGKDVLFLPECHSSNDKALELIRSGKANEGTIVICNHQTQGKGQRGNTWEAQPGQNLTFSLVLKPNFLDVSEQFFLNMVISNSIRRMLQDYLPDLKVKWPNDLVVPDRGKIGGVLIENIVNSSAWEFAVVGIGLNINQRDFLNKNATSLSLITGGQYELEELLKLLVAHLEQGYISLKKGKMEEVRKEYLSHLFLKDRWGTFTESEIEFDGKIVGVSQDGKLQIMLKDGSERFFGLKEITFPNL